MEENGDAGALIEEDYYTFFNISRDVSYTNTNAQYGYWINSLCFHISDVKRGRRGFTFEFDKLIIYVFSWFRQHRKRLVMLIVVVVAYIIPINMLIQFVRKKRKFCSTRLRKPMKVRSFYTTFCHKLVGIEGVSSSLHTYYHKDPPN